MAKSIQAIRGMHDVLPQHSTLWQFLERQVAAVLGAYGYREIRMPLLEMTELFKRSIGEVTDIVEKEMYTFEDRGGRSLTLRPEGTAGVMRAIANEGVPEGTEKRVFYMGPMFRHDRHQAGDEHPQLEPPEAPADGAALGVHPRLGVDAILQRDHDGVRTNQRPAGFRGGIDIRINRNNTGFGGDCVHRLNRHVVDHLTRGTALENTGADYLRVMEIVEAVYRSHETKRRVVLDATGKV